MRHVIAIVAAVFMAVLSQAVPALAHGGAHAGRDAALGSPPPPEAVGRAAALAPCDLPGREVVVVETTHPEGGVHDHSTHGDDHHHDLKNHNPADHWHPFGEDIVHQMMAHFSLDFAAYFQTEVVRIAITTRFFHVLVDDRTSGITIPPPIRPPLA